MDTFTQHAEKCRDHDDCTAIVCRRDQGNDVVWVSHLHADVHPAHRINPDHPAKQGGKALAHKPVSDCAPCRDHPAWKAVTGTA